MSDWSTRRHLITGLVGLGVGLGGFMLWAVFSDLNGAVIAGGEVAVEARRQAIQHPDGGLVAALHVKEGQVVSTGTPILTLDGTELAAQRAMHLRELAEVLAHLDRLHAEVNSQSRVTYGPELIRLEATVPGLAEVLADETEHFDARRATLRQTTGLLTERILETRAVIDGNSQQLRAARKQIALIREELLMQTQLLDQGLTLKTRVLALSREAAQLEGDIGKLESSIAEAKSSIAGFSMERLRVEAEFREKAQAELRSLQPKEAELREQLRLIETREGRLILRAPMAGTVLGLQAHTVGGVIPAGGEVASVVPSAVPLVLTVDVDPHQIDRVHAGQSAKIRFPNFNARTTPEVDGMVISVSADALAEPNTGRRFYRAELGLAPGAREKLHGQGLVPGMPVEAFIQTDSRSPASFLLKPLADYWSHAMREE